MQLLLIGPSAVMYYQIIHVTENKRYWPVTTVYFNCCNACHYRISPDARKQTFKYRLAN